MVHVSVVVKGRIKVMVKQAGTLAFRNYIVNNIKAKHLLRDYTTTQCKDHLQTLTVQSKFEGSADLEYFRKTWNRLLGDFHPGKLSFLLHAASDTLPTAVNLRRQSIQCDAKCSLCDSNRPTTAHILSSLPTALN